ncbi:MAG: hypothetical protein KDD61_05035 [Bdellovibrionales bacterium]|nr:hypothetical protein [Bdellovibrionales bacterium]
MRLVISVLFTVFIGASISNKPSGPFVGLVESFFFGAPCWGGELPKGYLDSVEEERKIRAVELVTVAKPQDEDPPLKEIIFDDELKSEFELRYEQEFGLTAIERNVEAPNRYDEFVYSNGTVVTEEEDMTRRQRFGEFMVRRLTEHHVDRYIQTNPNTKVVYDLKEKISKVKMQVKKGYELKVNYSYAGNTVAVEMKNPMDLENQILFVMDPNAAGPSEVEETLLNLGYPIGTSYHIRTQYKLNDGIVDLIGEKPIQPGMTASLTGSTYTKDVGVSTREHRVLLGFTWTH